MKLKFEFSGDILRRVSLLLSCLLVFVQGYAQKTITINLAPVDGVEITPENVFNYQVQSSFATNNALIKGTLRYRNSNVNLSYSFAVTIMPGLNVFNSAIVHPQWQFSSGSLQELFLTYGKLPEGTIEYCVTVIPNYKPGVSEQASINNFEECLYHQEKDILLIDLIDPENNAKIHEYNPNLSWVANCSFASELSYRVRVTDIKQGQNPQAAIARNNPVYSESNLMQNSIIYPIYAKPLVAGQPYAWTVDAYFKGILLGGAETWKFTIVDDTLPKAKEPPQAYFDFEKHKSDSRLSVPGTIKLRYVSEIAKDTLFFTLTGDDNTVIAIPDKQLIVKPGENLLAIVFADKVGLSDGKNYTLTVTTASQKVYHIPFNYLNPMYIK